MRVVFLDMDGVMNSTRFVAAYERDCEEKRIPMRWENHVDKVCIARLNRLVQEAGAVVVISSSWRKLLDQTAMSKVLHTHGYTGEVVGMTPDYSWKEGPRQPRGAEIQGWLTEHPEVTEFVILDDDSDMDTLAAFHVKTSVYIGLTDQHVEQALQLFAAQPPRPTPA